MTPAKIRQAGEELARRSTRAQGLPVKVADPRTVGTLAEMIGPPRREIVPHSEGPRGHHARGPSATTTTERTNHRESYPAPTATAI